MLRFPASAAEAREAIFEQDRELPHRGSQLNGSPVPHPARGLTPCYTPVWRMRCGNGCTPAATARAPGIAPSAAAVREHVQRSTLRYGKMYGALRCAAVTCELARRVCCLRCREDNPESARRLRSGRVGQSPRRLQHLATSVVLADDGVQGTSGHRTPFGVLFHHTKRTQGAHTESRVSLSLQETVQVNQWLVRSVLFNLSFFALEYIAPP